MISLELWAETFKFYHRINFCLLSQMFGARLNEVKKKMFVKSVKHQAEKFDLGSALLPLKIIDLTFLTTDAHPEPEDFMKNPLTLLGMKMKPYCFKIEMVEAMIQRSEEQGHPLSTPAQPIPTFTYKKSEAEEMQQKARRKKKKDARTKAQANRGSAGSSTSALGSPEHYARIGSADGYSPPGPMYAHAPRCTCKQCGGPGNKIQLR